MTQSGTGKGRWGDHSRTAEVRPAGPLTGPADAMVVLIYFLPIRGKVYAGWNSRPRRSAAHSPGRTASSPDCCAPDLPGCKTKPIEERRLPRRLRPFVKALNSISFGPPCSQLSGCRGAERVAKRHTLMTLIRHARQCRD